MAYGLWLYKEIINDTGNKTRLEIEKRDYSGQSFEITALSGDIVLSIDGGSATDPIVKSNLSFSIIDTAQVTYSDFFTPDATLYRVKIYDVNGQTQTVRWTGFVTPDSFGEPLTYRGQINLTARDNLGYLNDLEFDYNNVTAESYVSIKSIINAAIAKIGGMPLVWNVAKKASTAADGTFDNIEDAIVSTYTMLGDTWGNVVSELLKGIGCQLRYIDNNTFAVYDIEVLSDSATFTAQQVRFLEQSGYREIQPAWKKGIFGQDYLLYEENPINTPQSYSGNIGYLQNEGRAFNYGATIKMRSGADGWFIRSGDALNPFTWGLTSPYDARNSGVVSGAIYIPYYDTTEATRATMFAQKGISLSGLSEPLTVSFSVSPYLRASVWTISSGAPGHVQPALIESNYLYSEHHKYFHYNIIFIGVSGAVYVMRSTWELASSLTENLYQTIEIPSFQRLTNYPDTSVNVNVMSIPEPGVLGVRIYPPSGTFKLIEPEAPTVPFRQETCMMVRDFSIKIADDVEVSAGRSRQGFVSASHNISEEEEYAFGQVPDNSSIIFFKGGLYKNDSTNTPYSHFKRNSSATATDNLLDLIGRETIQYHKKSWDILSGTVQVTDRTSVMRFGTFAYGGKRYLPISAALNLLANQMSVTSMLEIENYVEEASIVFSDYTGKSSYSGRSGGGSSSGGSGGTSISSHNQLAGRSEDDAHPMTAITGLSDFKDLFDSMFEKVTSGNDWYIRAKKDFCSIGGITGYGENQGGGGGASNLYQLNDVPDYRTSYRGKILKSKSDGSGVEWVDMPTSAVWGNITGNLSAQTDLANALSGKAALSHTHTKSQITDFAHTHSISDVTGLQTALNGKQATISDLATIRSNATNGNTAYGWGNHASQGYLKSITKTMVENVLTGNIASHTHSYLPLNGGTMSGAIQMAGNRIKCNTYTTHSDLLDDTSHGLTTFSIATPAESSVSYLGILSVNDYYKFQVGSSGSGGNILKYRGYNSNNSTWDNWVNIYHSGNLTNLSQLTDNLGSNPVHTHSQYLTSALAASTYHPKGGSTALALSAASLTLAGAISGVTAINSKLTFNSDNIYSSVPLTVFGASYYETKFTGPSININQSGREGGWRSRIAYQQAGTRIGTLGGANIETTGVASYFYGGETDTTCAINILGSNGNVGIGTTSPAQKLDLIGKLRLRNASNVSKYIDLEIDSDGNLKINGNVLTTGGVTSYQSN